jgi:hypothetical protein
MNVPVAEPIANVVFIITDSLSEDIADDDGEAEMVGLGAKDCDGTKSRDAMKALEPASVSLRYWRESVNNDEGRNGRDATIPADAAI